MDALLQCLRMEAEAEESNKSSNNNNGARDVSAGGNAMTNDQKSMKKRRASIVMLESPTGTGKSLSLACSAVAWLRYREEMDLRSSKREEDTDNDDGTSRAAYGGGNDTTKAAKAVTPSPTNATSSGGSKQAHTTGLDWIDSFLSPDERAEQDRVARVEDGRRRAVTARRVLADELDKIRDRLDRAAANVHTGTSAGGSDAVGTGGGGSYDDL